MKNICVFCGSSMGDKIAYQDVSENFGKIIVQNNLKLIYGAGNIGLMGALADAVLNQGGEVVGIIPEFLVAKEVAHQFLTELIVVDSMHERKKQMADLADGFVTLPGGIGTFEEFFEIFTWAQLGLHQKPIGLLNIEGYYNIMLQLLDNAVKEGFLKQAIRDMIFTDNDPVKLLDKMKNYQAPTVAKWLNKERI